MRLDDADIAQVLRKLAQDASSFLGTDVKRAVITVPGAHCCCRPRLLRVTLLMRSGAATTTHVYAAYFNDAQRQATKDAGRIAGLDTLRIINEPTAASLAYGFDKKANETILVFDLGGGTFDVSVLEVGDGVFEVLSTSGDTHLGGDDFDKKVVDWLVSEFKRDEGIDLSKDRKAMQRLTEAAIKAKEELSTLTQVAINLPFVTATAEGPKHIDASLSRAKFEALCEDLFERCKAPVARAMEDAQLTTAQIKEVVLVGGSTRIPRVQQLVRQLTGKEPNLTVNPDEVVALGAAVQAGVLSGEVDKIVLLDVTPLSLGVETLGGVMTKLIPRNTTLPTTKSEVFSTAADSQTTVEVHVLQGEREFARDNKSLGNFRLDGIPPAPRGVPQVEVTFDISADGILRVTARDKASGKRSDISITGASTLSADDVARATKEAERYAEEDKKRRALVDARNEAEALTYQTQRQLKEFADKVPADVAARVREKADALTAAAAGEDAGAIRAALDALREAASAIGQAMYGSGASGGGSAQQPGGDGTGAAGASSRSAGGDPGVIDAEFTDSS